MTLAPGPSRDAPPPVETLTVRSLAQKIGVKPGFDVVLLAAPKDWTITGLDDSVQVLRAGSAANIAACDVVIAFFRSASEVEAVLSSLAPRIFPDAAIWAAWPRRAGGHHSDITDEVIRSAAVELGLVDVKVAALDGDWSGLRLVWRKALRTAKARGARRGTARSQADPEIFTDQVATLPDATGRAKPGDRAD